MNQSSYRSINIILCVAGVLCGAASGFVPAPAGLLADESRNALQVLQGSRLLGSYALPVLLFVLAMLMVIIGRLPAVAILASVAGSALFALQDVRFAEASQAYPGVLLNAIGCVLVLAGVCLQSFATPDRAALAAAEEAEDEWDSSVRQPSAYDDMYLQEITPPATVDDGDALLEYVEAEYDETMKEIAQASRTPAEAAPTAAKLTEVTLEKASPTDVTPTDNMQTDTAPAAAVPAAEEAARGGMDSGAGSSMDFNAGIEAMFADDDIVSAFQDSSAANMNLTDVECNAAVSIDKTAEEIDAIIEAGEDHVTAALSPDEYIAAALQLDGAKAPQPEQEMSTADRIMAMIDSME